MLTQVSDPEVIAWLESAEGIEWARRNLRIAVGGSHFFSLKRNVELSQAAMHYRKPGEELLYKCPTTGDWLLPPVEEVSQLP